MMAEKFAPEKQSLEVLSLDCDLAQEKQNELAELAKLFSSDGATFEEVSKFYDKQVEKWAKRVSECTKVIQDNQHFYQEGRKVWMKDLATLTKALRNMKTAFEDMVQDVLAHTTSLERKLCEILNETAPYSKAQPDSLERRSELEQLSSTFVLVKISAEIREKFREMAKFHAKIDSLLENDELIKGIEIETSKTIEKVSKYLGAGSNTTEATHQHELSEEGKSETRQHKQIATRSNLTKASLSVQPVKDQKLLKPSEFIGEQGKQSQIQNIIHANQNCDVIAGSGHQPVNRERKTIKNLNLEPNKQHQQKDSVKQLSGTKSPLMGHEPPIKRPAVFVSSNNCKNLAPNNEKEEQSADNSRKSNREEAAARIQNISYQSIVLLEKEPTNNEVNLETESRMHSFRKKVDEARLSPIIRSNSALDTSRRKDSQSSCNPFPAKNADKENANPNLNPIQQPPTKRLSKFRYFICGCK